MHQIATIVINARSIRLGAADTRAPTVELGNLTANHLRRNPIGIKIPSVAARARA